MNLSLGFSRAVGSASDTSNDKVLYQPINPVTSQSVSEKKIVKILKKITFPEDPTCIAEFLHATARYPRPLLENITSIPFQGTRQNLRVRNTPCLLGSTNPVQLLFTCNPSPFRPSQLSFEYLLLPPRFAPRAVFLKLTPRAL